MSLADDLAELRARVETTEALLAIRDLKARYADLVDSRFSRGQVIEVAALQSVAVSVAELFTEDGVWDGGRALGVATGRDAIAARIAMPTLTFSRHLFVQPRIELASDRQSASARWDLFCPCTTTEGTAHWMIGHEDDTYRLVDGRWLHASMKMTVTLMAARDSDWGRIFS